MDHDALSGYCLSRPGATAGYPFGPGPLVLKVMGRMFALIPDDPPLSITLKCDPVLAEILRQAYPAVRPGYHFNKRHWNTVSVDGSITDAEVRQMIDHSYDVVVRSLTRVQRAALQASGQSRT